LESIRRRLVEHDERLGNEQVLQVIEKAIQAEKSSKNANRLLTIGLLAAVPLAITSFTAMYLAIKLSDNDQTPCSILDQQDAIKKLIEKSTPSAPIASIQIAGDASHKDDLNHVVIGSVALEDIEQAWLDAQRGLQVTALAVLDISTRVIAVDYSEAQLTETADGDNIYAGLSTTGAYIQNFRVECDNGESTCAILGDANDGRELVERRAQGPSASCVIL
jgi:hypothetical protein